MITYLLFKDSDNPLLKPFKKGFRHIEIVSEGFVVGERGEYISILNPINNYIELSAKIIDDCYDDKNINIGLVVEWKRTKRNFPRFKISLFTCVNFACYAIGTHPRVLTPYGLYKALTTKKFKSILSVEEL